MRKNLQEREKRYNFALANRRRQQLMVSLGEVAEWSIAAVLKTVEGNTSGGSNPSLSAKIA